MSTGYKSTCACWTWPRIPPSGQKTENCPDNSIQGEDDLGVIRHFKDPSCTEALAPNPQAEHRPSHTPRSRPARDAWPACGTRLFRRKLKSPRTFLISLSTNENLFHIHCHIPKTHEHYLYIKKQWNIKSPLYAFYFP